MLRIVLLSAMLLIAGAIFVVPEAAAWNPCEEGVIADNTRDCKGAGPCWRQGLSIVCEV